MNSVLGNRREVHKALDPDRSNMNKPKEKQKSDQNPPRIYRSIKFEQNKSVEEIASDLMVAVCARRRAASSQLCGFCCCFVSLDRLDPHDEGALFGPPLSTLCLSACFPLSLPC